MGVQRGVHEQMRKMLLGWPGPRSRFTLDGRQTDDDICNHPWLGRVRKREDIGGAVLSAKLVIQPPPFAGVDEAQGQLSVALQRCEDPAP